MHNALPLNSSNSIFICMDESRCDMLKVMLFYFSTNFSISRYWSPGQANNYLKYKFCNNYLYIDLDDTPYQNGLFEFGYSII